MNPSTSTAVLGRLKALLPAGRVLGDAAPLAAYESDGLNSFKTGARREFPPNTGPDSTLCIITG